MDIADLLTLVARVIEPRLEPVPQHKAVRELRVTFIAIVLYMILQYYIQEARKRRAAFSESDIVIEPKTSN